MIDIKDGDNLSGEKIAEVVRSLKDMLASEGWRHYISIIQEQREIRVKNVLYTPLPSMDAALEQEFKKGEIATLDLVTRLPAQMVEDFTQTLEYLRKQEENQDDNPVAP